MATANIPPGAVPTNGMADPFASSPSSAPFRYAAFDSEHFSLAANHSPSSARRALEAHLKNTDRRIHEASRLGTTLIQQRKDLAARLNEVEQMQTESEVPEALRHKLSELEREYHEVGRESARAFLPKSRVVSEANDPSAGSGIISGSGRESPTKAQAPSMSRRQRNQPANRVHDIEFATEISTSLIAQVRQLQAALSEKDDELKDTTAAKALLEAEAAHLVQRLRHMDENEQKYKDENWSLETKLQDMEANLRESMDKESRLVQTLKSTQTEKATKERELDDLKVSHEKLNEDHAMAKKVQEADLHGLKRDAAVHETEKSRLERRIAELVAQNTELARAVSYRMNQSAQQSETDFVSAEEGIQSDEQSPLDSAPPSPTKGTPARHGMLEQETLKSSLNHAHRMIQNLKNTIHREKTEKIELKRMLQDARDELETRREGTGVVGANVAKKRRSEPEGVKFKRPSANRLGATRTSTTEVLEDEPDWEDHEVDQTPSKSRSVGVAAGAAALGAAGMAGYDHASGRSEDDSTDAFDTAHERDTTTESEAFATGKEDFGDDNTDGDLTETEGNAKNTLRSVGSFTSRPKAEHRQSYMSSASMSGDDDDDVVRTPIQNAQQPKYKLRLSRGVRRTGRVGDVMAYSPSAASNDSPASSTGTPQHAQQTLGDELDALDEDSMDGTPSSSFVMDYEGTPITQKEADMEPGNERVVRKPEMVDSGMMTEHWEPERVVEERIVEKEVRVEVPVQDQSLKDHAGEVMGGALAGIGVGRFVGGNHDNAREVGGASQTSDHASHEDLTHVPRTVDTRSDAQYSGLEGLTHGENHTQIHLPTVADPRDDEIENYKAQIAQVNKLHEDQVEQHRSEIQQAQQARQAEVEQHRLEIQQAQQARQAEVEQHRLEIQQAQQARYAELERIKSEMKQEQDSRDAESQDVKSQMQQLHDSRVAEVEKASAEIKQLKEARAAEVEKYRHELTQVNQSRETEQQSYRKEVETLKQQGIEASQAIAQLKLDHNSQVQHFKGLVNELSEKLTVAEQERDDLQRNHISVTSQLGDLSRQHAQVRSQQSHTELEKEQLKQEHFNFNTQLEHLKSQLMEMQSKHDQAQETIRVMTPEPVNFAFSDLIAQDLKPIEIELPAEHDTLVPGRSSKRRNEQEPKTLLTDNYHDHPLAATNEEENVPDESPVLAASFPRPPLAELSTNTPHSRSPPSIPTADEGSQTLVSGRDIDNMLRNKTAVVPIAAEFRDGDNSLMRNAAISGAATDAAASVMPPVTTSPSKDRSAVVRPSSYESPTLRQPRRQSSSGSMRAKAAPGAPPLPPDHTKKIAEAQRAPGSSTGQPSFGTMGPPVMPASAYKRPSTNDRPTNERVGSRDATTPRPLQTRASRSQMASDRLSHRTSVSSFASELDERFNITRGHMMYPDDIKPPTDPRMIQAITQTMIGEYLWKYTRKAGRSETSKTRHRRFFWVHPYTRTLYWSEQDPSTAGKNMLKAKSVAIEAVRVITDDNTYPPGLYRKSLVVVTPGREIVFTAPTAQRHETWFNALSYLLLRTDKEKGEAEDAFDERDLDEFRAGISGSVSRSISKMTGQQRSTSRQSGERTSLSSYNSRTTRNTSPQRHDADRTVTSRNGTVTQHSKSLQPPTLNHGLTSIVSNNSRQPSGSVGGRFTSLTSRFRPSSSGRSGSAMSNRRDNLDPASIYDASVVADSAEDLRAVIEQQERQADRLEDVRACCDGRHNVGSLSRANGRHSHGHHSHSHRH